MKSRTNQVAPIEALFFRDFRNSHLPEIFDEIYLKQVYAPFVTGRTDMIIADWGANQGMTSYFFKNYAKQVYAVEPAKQHQEVIETMLAYNKIKNVKLCKYAVSNENGKTKFYHNENTTMFSLSDVVSPQDDFEEVETVDPYTFFTREGITHLDLLKLDVEGSESRVILSEGFSKIKDKIKVIVGEWHNWDTQNQGAFMNTFRDLGFEFRWLPNTQASVFTAVRI